MITWNIYHGRAVPGARRPLLAEFAAALAGWEWDVALLQEAPPWWPEPLGEACGAVWARVLTSRNQFLPARRFLGRRWPDTMKSGGGSNAILVRGQPIREHAEHRLCRWPERRKAHGVRLADGTWCVNLHASTSTEGAARDVAEARAAALDWAGGGPLVLGGDLNTRHPLLPAFTRAAWHEIDGVWVRGVDPVGAEVLDAGALSDHAPVRATLSGRAATRTPAA